MNRLRANSASERSWPICRKKRFLDLLFSISLFFLLSPLMASIASMVCATSEGAAIYWSARIGRNNRIFKMPKFRTMFEGTPTIATHLLLDPERWVTPIGRLLRRFSLDELPQLYSVFKGDMSFVGPRPALFNQDDLVALRTQKGIHRLVPGITGWAQINGRDELPIPVKVAFDEEYLRRRSLRFDLRILALTAVRALAGKGVTH